MSNLPDLDTLTAEELEKLAAEAREEMSALSELWLIISEATVEEKIALAGTAILGCRKQTFLQYELDYYLSEHPGFTKAHELLKKVNSTRERISFAIAVLEGVMPDSEDDDDEEEEEDDDDEIEEALSRKNLNKAFNLAAESEAIKEFYAGNSLY